MAILSKKMKSTNVIVVRYKLLFTINQSIMAVELPLPLSLPLPFTIDPLTGSTSIFYRLTLDSVAAVSLKQRLAAIEMINNPSFREQMVSNMEELGLEAHTGMMQHMLNELSVQIHMLNTFNQDDGIINSARSIPIITFPELTVGSETRINITITSLASRETGNAYVELVAEHVDEFEKTIVLVARTNT
jgi:hypothetical protein